MSNPDPQLVFSSLRLLLKELIDGPPGEKMSFVLNPGDAGLLANLETLSAEQASARSIPGRSSLAGHAGHLRFSLELLNRWSRGENPFADADWKGSWRHQTVTEPEWRELRDSLAAEAHAWIDAVEQPREWDKLTFTGALSSAAHVAYHLGAIRQLMGHAEAGS